MNISKEEQTKFISWVRKYAILRYQLMFAPIDRDQAKIIRAEVEAHPLDKYLNSLHAMEISLLLGIDFYELMNEYDTDIQILGINLYDIYLANEITFH